MNTLALTNTQIGVTFGFRAKAGYFESPEGRAEADSIAAAGIKWVTLVPTVYQEHYYSERQFADFERTPSDLEIVDMINYLHSLGLFVQLRPMLESLDGTGRLQVNFPPDVTSRIPGLELHSCSNWFAAMKARAVHYAKIAERTGCELYCLDSELDRIISYNKEWKEVIKAVRAVYHNPLTSCHTSHTGVVDFESALANKDHWFYDLDMLSISCYHRAVSHPGATVDEIRAGFASQLERFRGYAKLYGKPILFGECGCTSSVGGATRPSGWSTTPTYDGNEQAAFFEAVIETFRGEPWWRGLCQWKWDEQMPRPFLDADPAGNSGFTIKGKPAEKLFARYNAELS